jgi:alcohol dehydrogenase class IV
MKLMDASYPDLVIALGGGSVIDAAKAVIFALAQTRPQAGRQRPASWRSRPPAVPAEVTAFSVVKAHAEKLVLVDPSLLPDIAILDPALVASVPPAITADTGMDVLCHALEAYVSRAASDFSDALAEKWCSRFSAICPPAGAAATTCWRRKDAQRLLHGGHGVHQRLAGHHPQPGPCARRRLSRPHGRANALLMADVVAWNADYHGQCATDAARKYARLAHLLDLPAANTRQGVASLLVAIQALKDEMTMPAGIAIPAFPARV